MKIEDIQEDFNRRKVGSELEAYFNGVSLFFMLGQNALFDVPVKASDLNDLDLDPKMLEKEYHKVTDHDKLLILETVLHVLNTPEIELTGQKVYQVVYTWSDYSGYVENTVGIATNKDLAFKMACALCTKVEDEADHTWEDDRIVVREFYLDHYDPKASQAERHLYETSDNDNQIVLFKKDEKADQFTTTKEGHEFVHQ